MLLQKSVDVVNSLQKIVTSISAETERAAQRGCRYNDDGEYRSCAYDNVASTSPSTQSAAAEIMTSGGGRFVSNTLVTLSTSELSNALPRTRTTMRELQDSASYVSFTSPKDLPICRPPTAVRQRPPTPAADVEKEWKQIVYAAETVIDSGSSVEDLQSASLERLCPADAVTKSTPQPLSFANPLFIYRTASRPSSASLERSAVQKAISLTSVDGSDGLGSPPQSVGGRRAGHSRGACDVAGAQGTAVTCGWKPSSNRECLADGVGSRQPQSRHSVVLLDSGPSTEPPSLSGSLSQCSELAVACDTETSKPSSTVSSILGLDTPPESPHGSSASCRGVRRIAPSQNSVRMGVSSMQRRPAEVEKSKIEA